jgi:hypothetical protein
MVSWLYCFEPENKTGYHGGGSMATTMVEKNRRKGKDKTCPSKAGPQ